MTRPADWWVLDLPGDPVPGDPQQVRALARSAAQMAADGAEAHRAVRALAGDAAVLRWLGAAADVFRDALEGFPGQLGKLEDSYEQAAQALTWWAGRLDDLQSHADRALEQGRQARAEIDALTAQLSSARAAVGAASAASARLADVPAGRLPPGPAQVRAATRDLQAAQSRVSGLSSSLSDAQSRLSAARSLAEQARELRREDARTVQRRLHEASDAGVQPASRWQRLKEAAARAWEATVQVATVVAVVVAVVALVVGGPLVWGVLLAAGAVLLADSIGRYAREEGSAWEVGLDALGVVPGGRLITAVRRASGLAGAGTRGAGAVGRPLSAVGIRLRSAATALRARAADLSNRYVPLPGSVAASRRGWTLDGFGDPIPPPTQGMPVWRVYGEAQDAVGGLQRGSLPSGPSWTPKDPRLSDDFRIEAGLPDENPGRFLVEGRLGDPRAVTRVRPALPLHDNPGGWPEYLIDDAAVAVRPVRVTGVNEPWTRQPGDWSP